MKVQHIRFSVECPCGRPVIASAENVHDKMAVFTISGACPECGTKYHLHLQESKHEKTKSNDREGNQVHERDVDAGRENSEATEE